MSRLWRPASLVGLALALVACPGPPREVVYDLAARAPVADHRSSADVILFGTPGVDRRLGGFYTEGASLSAEPFLWSRQDVEVTFQWEAPEPRVAILDAAPYEALPEQNVEVLLNGTTVESFGMNDQRGRYRIGLPAGPQKPGENVLRFEFTQAASPAEDDPENRDRRRLAARFYALVTGPSSEDALDDLLGRDAPRPFTVETDDDGIPRVVLIGPARLSFHIRLPESAELRFTPALNPAAQAAAGAASFRVLIEGKEGGEEELWSEALGPGSADPQERVVALPGESGDFVRLTLAVDPIENPRFAWGQFGAPRVLGHGRPSFLQAPPLSDDENARADPLRQDLDGMNVVFVILDAARAAQLGTYGYPRPTTPVIDRIASEGVVFEGAYTPAVYTLAAMSSTWTSQYPDRHHADLSFSARLSSDRLTLAELLAGEGVHTAGFTANAMSGRAFGLDRGFDEFHELFKTLGSGGDVFRQVLPRWLGENKDRRFFAYVHFREPHFPYDPEPPFDTAFGPEGPIPKESRRDFAFFKAANQGGPFSEEEQAHLVRLYDGNLAFADQEVGALREALEAEGLWDRTVFILAADHGEELYEKGFIGHNVHVYEPSIRIPLIVRLPSGVGPSGVRIGGLVDLLDVAPTVADVFGVLGRAGSDASFRGRSLLPVISGAPTRPAVLSRTVWDLPRYGLRHEGYKYIYDSQTGEGRLFDLAADPDESQDVASADPLRVGYYRQELHHWRREAGEGGAATQEGSHLSPDQCENLRALGYLEDDCS